MVKSKVKTNVKVKAKNQKHDFKEMEQIQMILLEIDQLTADIKKDSKKSTKRRSKLGLYNDILSAVQEESYNDEVKPTRIQFRSKTSYDKLQKYLKELTKKGMITNNPLGINEKGRKFLEEYEIIKEKLDKIDQEFL